MFDPKYKPEVVPITPRIFEFRTGPRECFPINIEGKDYEACEYFSDKLWTKDKKKGKWNNGLNNTELDPRRVERIGLLGEMATAKLLGSSVNFEYSIGGEPHDFVFPGGNTADVKTSMKKPRYEAGLIRAVTRYGKQLNLESDIYICGFLNYEYRDKKRAQVVLVGHQSKPDILKTELKPAIKGSHWNYQLEYNELKDMRDLLSLYPRE